MGLGRNQHKVERAKGVDTARGGERVWKGSCLSFQAQLGCGANTSRSSQIMSAATVPTHGPDLGSPFSVLRCCTKSYDLSLSCIWKPPAPHCPFRTREERKGSSIEASAQGNTVFAFLRECSVNFLILEPFLFHSLVISI